MATTTTTSSSSCSSTTVVMATLLLRDRHSGGTSLSATVQRARARQPPHPNYRLQLNTAGTHLEMTAVNVTTTTTNNTTTTTTEDYNNLKTSPDEGFESDIDSLSIVSNDSIVLPPVVTTETDSANGSACSEDSDDSSNNNSTNCDKTTSDSSTSVSESYSLVNILCYTDVTCPDLLLVVIDAADTLVFRFGTTALLTVFYANFSALKAVSQQRAYSTIGARFNLLQRTDTDGVTHTKITKWSTYNYEPSSIISLEGKYSRSYENRQRLPKSLSTENILETTEEYHSLSYNKLLGDRTLRKVWSSAENLLDSTPVKPERRKRVKNKAPQPPVPPPPVVVPPPTKTTAKTMRNQFQQFFSGTMAKTTNRINQNTYQPFKFSDPKHLEPQRGSVQYINPWSSTVPRLLRPKDRRNVLDSSTAKLDTRRTFISHLSTSVVLPPIRYVHTPPLQNLTVLPVPPKSCQSNSLTFSNRLFGMSSKLRDFTSVQCGSTTAGSLVRRGGNSRWNSLGELAGTYHRDGSANLKSVIKKEDAKKKNEKKVTFSDFTTVKVL